MWIYSSTPFHSATASHEQRGFLCDFARFLRLTHPRGRYTSSFTAVPVALRTQTSS